MTIFIYLHTCLCQIPFSQVNNKLFICWVIVHAIVVITVSNSLDADQDQHFVHPDLGSNCLQRQSADDKVAASKEKVEPEILYCKCS